MTERCSSCRGRIAPEVLQAQREELNDGGHMCRSCIDGIQSNGSMQSLLDATEDALSVENAAQFAESGFSKKAWFVVQCINKGHIDGGSPGFHHHLRRWVVLDSRGLLDGVEA